MSRTDFLRDRTWFADRTTMSGALWFARTVEVSLVTDALGALWSAARPMSLPELRERWRPGVTAFARMGVTAGWTFVLEDVGLSYPPHDLERSLGRAVPELVGVRWTPLSTVLSLDRDGQWICLRELLEPEVAAGPVPDWFDEPLARAGLLPEQVGAGEDVLARAVDMVTDLFDIPFTADVLAGSLPTAIVDLEA